MPAIVANPLFATHTHTQMLPSNNTMHCANLHHNTHSVHRTCHTGTFPQFSPIFHPPIRPYIYTPPPPHTTHHTPNHHSWPKLPATNHSSRSPKERKQKHPKKPTTSPLPNPPTPPVPSVLACPSFPYRTYIMPQRNQTLGATEP